MLGKIYNHFMSSSLYRNSIYLIASSISTAFFGFLFWILSARNFSTDDIGIATTMVSTTGFISEFSLLGLKNSLVRYLPKSGKRNLEINTGINVVLVVTIVLAIVFIFSTPIVSDELVFLKSKPVFIFYLTLFLVAFSLNQMQEGIFIAYRSAGYVLVKNVLWGLAKLVLPMILIGFGAFGVFTSFSVGSLVSLIFGFYVLVNKFDFKAAPVIDLKTLKQVGRFSVGDYIGIFLANIPFFVLPLLIINRLGPDKAAFYYIAVQIAGLLFIIPGAVNQSLFAEGSQEEGDIRKNIIESSKFTFTLIIPLILLTVVLGGYLLQIFGDNYSENAFTFLRIMAISGIFVGINQIGSALLHVQKRVGLYVLLNFLSASIIVILSLVLLTNGLFGVGLAHLIGYGAVSVCYLFVIAASLR